MSGAAGYFDLIDGDRDFPAEPNPKDTTEFASVLTARLQDTAVVAG
jgi:hypothetical protein